MLGRDQCGSIRSTTERVTNYGGTVVGAMTSAAHATGPARSFLKPRIDALRAPLCYAVAQEGTAAMTSRHLSVRVEAATFERLNVESRRVGQTRSQLAKTLLEEGLRMAAHPNIVFRSGPAG